MYRSAYKWPENIAAPVADKKPNELVAHGDARTDDYYWMADYFRDGPDGKRAVDYLEAENAYLDTMMAGLKDFRKSLFAEMKGRIKEKDESVPVFKNGYYYYNRYEEGKQYFVYCRRKGNLNAPEEILLDINEMARDFDYYSVRGLSVSPDNRLLVFGVDTLSRRRYHIYIKDLETGRIFPEDLYPTTGVAVWANDNRTLFYTVTNPETLLTEKIRKHRLESPPEEDELIYEEKDPSNYIGVSKTKSGKFILINSTGTLSSELWYLDADCPDSEFSVFQPRLKEVLYSVDHQNDRFLILTNKEAMNFRLMECPLEETTVEHWEEIIPHRSDVLLEGVDVFSKYLVITERKEGLLKFRVREIAGGAEHYIDFDEPAYSAYVGDNPEYNSGQLRYTYTSLTTPLSTYDYDLASHEKKLMKRQEIVGGYDPADYATERIYATARDGAKVPISLVYRKGFVKDGRSPLLLYGYGSYGISVEPTFNAARLSLLDRGFVYAIAHVRGGQELGRQWYEDGKLMKKKNTFNDFIDCGEFLIKENYTSSGHLYARGGSAGGLLMGAVATMRPDLWNGVVAAVPFVDVVTTMLDESIPLTTNEFNEWGNPGNKDAYNYMKSYSPYDNVGPISYPNLLVMTGLHDSQVQYFEPEKWVAKMRANKTGEGILLLHTNMEAGHGGASGRFDYLKDVALEYAFLLALEGVKQ